MNNLNQDASLKGDNLKGLAEPTSKKMMVFWGLLTLLIINALLIILLGDEGVTLASDGSINPCTVIDNKGTFYFLNVSYLIIGATWLIFGFSIIFGYSVLNQEDVSKNPVLIKLTAGISSGLLFLAFLGGAIGALSNGGLVSLLSFLSFPTLVIFGLIPLLIATLIRRVSVSQDNSFFAKAALPLLISQSILIFLITFFVLASFSVTPDQLTCNMI